jgi:crotonobetainyl-CoA:carnitine CoA-transferase CaiB-like acyl-CoA transferase
MLADPLAGIRVLDLTRLLPGPMCSLHLADMGADVIKVEDTRQGDYAREMGTLYASVNRNKRSLSVDLKQDAGRDIFLRLADTADVIIEGFRPGTVDRLRIGYDDIEPRNPKVVYCAITGYGQSGPFRDRAGHDLNYASYAGVTDQTGARGGPPVIANLQVADLLGGSLSAVMGILAALLDAQRSGRGRYVDVAMADCTLAHAVLPLSAYHQRGAVAPRGEDMLNGGLPWYAIYQTADGRHVALASLEEKFWRRFCAAVGRDRWIDAYHADAQRREVVRTEVSELFKSGTQAHWVTALEAADCCFSPVLTLGEALDHPQFAARDMVHRSGDGLPRFAFPVRFSDFTFGQRVAAPARGEHSNEILEEIGYTSSEIEALCRNGTV